MRKNLLKVLGILLIVTLFTSVLNIDTIGYSKPLKKKTTDNQTPANDMTNPENQPSPEPTQKPTKKLGKKALQQNQSTTDEMPGSSLKFKPKMGSGDENNTGKQTFSSKGNELSNKLQAFDSNTKSFTKMAKQFEKMSTGMSKPQNLSNTGEFKELDQAIDAMLKNNADLQKLVKGLATQQSNDRQKSFYTRDILPNLQNINRQLMRIKDNAKRNPQNNIKNIIMQAQRVEESSGQLVDRLKKNAQ